MARALLQTAIPATGARCPARSARVSRVVRAAARRSSDSSDAALGRRDAVVGAGALLMLTTRVAPATAEDEAPDAAPEAPAAPKYGKPRVVITGSNSGIGFDAAKKLAKSGDWCVVLACRTVAKAEQAKASMRSEFPSIDPNDVQCYACDLGDMASIRQFAKDVTAEGPVDALCLNAGLEYSGDPTVYRTKDGFEKREVVLGRTDGQSTEIVFGLDPGEEIAVANTFTLKAELGKSEASHAH